MKPKDRSIELKIAHDKCVEAFGLDEALIWMTTENKLGGRPLDLIDTDEGLKSVLRELNKILKKNRRAMRHD